jgi:hypothetical protein
MTTSTHIPAGRSRFPRWLAAPFVLAAIFASGTADAADPPSQPVDWGRLAAALVASPDVLRVGPPHEPTDGSSAVPWVGAEPRVSLVARDWSGSRGLYGDTTILDDVRPAHSSRMVMSRIRLASGVVSPFAQLGVGEWRVDSTLLPKLPHETTLATQTGFGFEVGLGEHTVAAVEADWTLLDPQGGGDVIAQTHPAWWGGTLALRTRF